MDENSTPRDDIQLQTLNALVRFGQGHAAESEQELLRLIRETEPEKDHFWPYLYYGELLLQMGRLDQAREVLLRSAQVALKSKDDLRLGLSHEKLGDLSAAEESWFGALHHYRYALRRASTLLDDAATQRLGGKAEAVLGKLQSTVFAGDADLIPLSQEYAAGNLAISFAHRDIFQKKYFARCLQCDFCHDWCCSFGADIDIQNMEQIQQRREEILPFVRPPEGDWFEEGSTYHEEYAGNQYTRINPFGPRCAFISKDQRGCGLHRYALSRGMDYHEIKPLVCILFPLSFGEGLLTIAPELEDSSLVCAGAGDSTYRSLRNELEHYFGRELVEELDRIERAILSEE